MSGAPESSTEHNPEIEVTEPMLLAGLAKLPYFPEGTLGTLEEETLVSEVYRAMAREAARGHPCPRENAGRRS